MLKFVTEIHKLILAKTLATQTRKTNGKHKFVTNIDHVYYDISDSILYFKIEKMKWELE